MTAYSWANQSRRYDASFAGQRYQGGPDKGVLHTTETTTLPGYRDGRDAPHLTGVPDFAAEEIRWYQHFDSDRPSRALVGGGAVETNNDSAFQVELVGTCTKSGPGLYWPDAPEWALSEVRLMMRRVGEDRGIPFVQPSEGWLSYPESYGTSRVRMSPHEWDDYAGWCGHQHAPYNDHGDPGDLSALFQEEDEMTPEDRKWIKDTIRSQVTYALRDDPIVSLSDAERDRIYGNHDTSPSKWTIAKAAAYLSGQTPIVRRASGTAEGILTAQAEKGRLLSPEEVEELVQSVAVRTADELADEFEVTGDVRLAPKSN